MEEDEGTYNEKNGRALPCTLQEHWLFLCAEVVLFECTPTLRLVWYGLRFAFSRPTFLLRCCISLLPPPPQYFHLLSPLLPSTYFASTQCGAFHFVVPVPPI